MNRPLTVGADPQPISNLGHRALTKQAAPWTAR
jgi:hypothetical protein